MRKSFMLLAATGLLLAGAGQAAAGDRISDTAYLSAMRCRGLAEARQIDAVSLDAMLKAQKGGRESYIGDRAREMRREAVRDGRSTDLSRKARVDGELNGVCQSYLGSEAAMAATASTGG